MDRIIRLPGSLYNRDKDYGKVTLIQAKKELITLLGSGCKKLVGWKVIEDLEALNIHSKRYPEDLEIVELSKQFSNFRVTCLEEFGLNLNDFYHLSLGNLQKNTISFCVSFTTRNNFLGT